ncbi:MAG: LytTR family transcriptional regulator [Firmicutes bacterium]|nr:LytTR family transcriptional regulator [Bacillota bacterium]
MYPTKHYKAARISLRQGNERIFIRLCDIIFLEKSTRYTIIHTENGIFKTRDTLQDFEKKLGAFFFRSHKSYLINIEKIERIINFSGSSYHEIKFTNYDKSAFLSRARINELLKLLESVYLIDTDQ